MSARNPKARSFWQNLRIAAMWVFLGPLILILGIIDVLTKGRSRNWPFDARRDDKERN